MTKSATRATENIAVAPEPIEYVDLCDMYGAGWFLTVADAETCIKFSGYVRSTYSARHHSIVADSNSDRIELWLPYQNRGVVESIEKHDFVKKNIDKDESVYKATYRGRFKIDAKQETEYGALNSYVIFFNNNNRMVDDSLTIRTGFGLGGFRVGYSDSYWTTNHDYGAGSPAINDGLHNYDEAMFFDYTYWLGDVALTVGVQDFTAVVTDSQTYPVNDGGADFYAGLNWASDWGTFAFTTIYDRTANYAHDVVKSNGGGGTNLGAWAYKASWIWPVMDSGWKVGAWYSWTDANFSRFVNAYSLGLNNQWGAQINGNIFDNFNIYGLYSAASGGFAIGPHSTVDLNAQYYALGAIWSPVNNLDLQLEYHAFTQDYAYKNEINESSREERKSGFWVRLVRNF